MVQTKLLHSYNIKYYNNKTYPEYAKKLKNKLKSVPSSPIVSVDVLAWFLCSCRSRDVIVGKNASMSVTANWNPDSEFNKNCKQYYLWEIKYSRIEDINTILLRLIYWVYCITYQIEHQSKTK